MSNKESLKNLVVEAVQETLREARRLSETEVTLSHGRKVKFGHADHIKDLQARIHDLSVYRDQQRRGSEARSTYSRAIQRLRQQLKSAERATGGHKRTECGVTRRPRTNKTVRPVAPSDDAVFESIVNEVAEQMK